MFTYIFTIINNIYKRLFQNYKYRMYYIYNCTFYSKTGNIYLKTNNISIII